MNYILDSNILLLTLVVFSIILLIKNNKKLSILSSNIVVPIVMLVFIVLGNVNLLFFQKALGWYTSIDPTEGNRMALLSLLVFNLVTLIFTRDQDNKVYSKTVIKKQAFNRWIVILFLVGVFFNAFNYAKIGGILMFKSSLSGYERFDLMDTIPFAKAIILSSFLICPIVIRLVLFKEGRVLFTIILFINIILAGGLGHRHFIFMPFLTAMIFLYALGKIDRKWILILAVVFPLLVITMSYFRGDATNVALSDTNAMFGNEYRDYLRVRKDNVPIQDGKTMASLIFNIIPKPIYTIFNLKKEDYSIYSAYILQDFWGNESGQRAGIWGEFYMNFRDVGMVICFALFALVTIVVDYYLFKRSNNVRGKFIFSYWYTLVIFSIMGSWATIGDDISSYGIFYLFFFLVAFKKIRIQTGFSQNLTLNA